MSIVNPDNKKMVLSCDGGGIRGIIIARCLQKLEELEHKRCNEIFSLMVGTSTGAIIVGALAKGMPAKELVELYLKRGKEIFTKTPCLLTRWWRWKYTKIGVRKVFKQIFGDTALEDLPVEILISSTDTVRGETMFFEKHKTFGKMLLREAVESSMSAPTYFEPNGRYIDGGVGSFNNPCYQAAVEAVHYLNYPKQNIRILSFGTGREMNNMKEGEAEKKNIIGWCLYVIGEGMDDANEQQVELVRREYRARKEVEFRRYQLSFNNQVFTQIGVPLDKVKDPRIFAMDAVEHVGILNMIAEKFVQCINFTEKDGVELGVKPRLQINDYNRYLKGFQPIKPKSRFKILS